jgi:hypothetical protein
MRRYKQVRKPVKRYILLYFHYAIVLAATDEERNSIREVVNSIKGKLWKDDMVEEMESLHKNQKWDLVELINRIKHIGSKGVFKKNMN